MKKVLSTIVLGCAAVPFLMVSCKHEIPPAPNVVITPSPSPTTPGTVNTGSSTCSSDTVYFQNDLFPLINSGCNTSGCHDAVSHADGVDLSSYDKIRSYVSAGNASNSKLYKVLVKSGDERMPLPPLPAFTADQIAKVQKWINQGALNNACTGGCDTTKITYAAAVQPLMQTYCTGCHNAASAGGGIDLSTYAQVKTYATNGRLLGTISYATGYSPMPKGSKLQDCQITQIRKWIEAGALNN